MFKFLIFILPIIFISVSHAESGLEGRVATLTLDLKSLSNSKGVLTVNGALVSAELSTGFYFSTSNKFISLEVPGNCVSLAELAFAGNFEYIIKGELKKFNEKMLTPNEAAFNEKSLIRCDVKRDTKE